MSVSPSVRTIRISSSLGATSPTQSPSPGSPNPVFSARAGTALVAKGYVEASNSEPVIGALLTIVSVIWSVTEKRRYADQKDQVRLRK